MHYPAAVHYLFSFLNFERIPFRYHRELNVKRMRHLLDWFGQPEKKFHTILVAGTNGKGSTATFLASILLANHHAIGLYTSPHLNDPRERIRLNGQAISEADFAELVTSVRPVIESRKAEVSSFGCITFFEVFTLLAILYFARKAVRFAVFEVGMGGRLDATNVMDPILAVITPIGFDHMEHLGSTLEAIAREKAAIIKGHTYVVSGHQRPEAAAVIRNQIRRKGTKGYFFGSTFRVTNPNFSRRGGRFGFQMGRIRLRNLQIRLPGKFQIENAATALAASLVLAKENGCPLTVERTKRGLQTAFWPGRFEILKRKGRTIVLDGAHNEPGMQALCHSLAAFFPGQEKIVIVGVSREKNLNSILKLLAPLTNYFIATKAKNPRAQEPKVILETLARLQAPKPSFWSTDLAHAFEIASRIGARRRVLVITGSLFLVGEARELLKCRTFV